jgi:type II secretory pathway pseudopilin PulG
MKLRTAHFEMQRRRVAFTLLEVMIATGIFFMAMFAVLGLVSGTLHNARALQRIDVDAGMLAAELSLTNRLTEESVSGDFGDLYPGYSWQRDNYLWPVMPTNGLFQVDFTVSRRVGNHPVETRMSILLFRPDSQIGGGLR